MTADRQTLLVTAPVVLHGGRSSWFKIECDALTDRDVAFCAEYMARVAGPFGWVDGVPRGGLRLAEALGRYARPDATLRLLVDDVWTTGGSMRAHRERLALPAYTMQLCVFARRPPDDGTVAIFTMHEGG